MQSAINQPVCLVLHPDPAFGSHHTDELQFCISRSYAYKYAHTVPEAIEVAKSCTSAGQAIDMILVDSEATWEALTQAETGLSRSAFGILDSVKDEFHNELVEATKNGRIVAEDLTAPSWNKTIFLDCVLANLRRDEEGQRLNQQSPPILNNPLADFSKRYLIAV